MLGDQRARGRPDQRCGVDNIPATNGRQKFTGAEVDIFGIQIVGVKAFQRQIGMVGREPARLLPHHGFFQIQLGKQTQLAVAFPMHKQAEIIEANVCVSVAVIFHACAGIAAKSESGARDLPAIARLIVGTSQRIFSPRRRVARQQRQQD